MIYQAELTAALNAARKAASRIMELYVGFTAIPDAQSDITTQADRDSQELILQSLQESFPADAYLAEEATPTIQLCSHGGPRVWVIDPIDGTRGFAQKNGEFSIMIALVEHGVPVVGVVWEPALSRWTYATASGGCFTEAGKSCRVTTTSSLNRATLIQTHSKPGKPSRQSVALTPAQLVETYSAGVKLARVARGEADLYVNHYPNFNDWDIAAGQVLVTEAGGRVTGMKGQPIVYGKGIGGQTVGLLACNAQLHDEAVSRLQEVV